MALFSLPFSARILVGPMVGLLLAPLLPAADELDLSKLIVVRPGTIPIIVTAPHGGRTPIPGVPERKGDGIARFATVLDGNTAELADKLAAAIEKKLGGRPYLVIARFERKCVDANRSAKEAYEVDAAKPVYEAYHKAIADARAEILNDWGRGILLDLHGQGADAKGVFRGTNDGKTVAHLTERLGKTALTGPKSILGVLAKKGYNIIPANDAEDKEDRRFNGGFTVSTYGSADGKAFDALQLELGAHWRDKKALDQTADDLTEAVLVFAKEYLPAKKVK